MQVTKISGLVIAVVGARGPPGQQRVQILSFLAVPVTITQSREISEMLASGCGCP
jgi:hypothetical protein